MTNGDKVFFVNL